MKLTGILSAQPTMSASLSTDIVIKMQAKEVVPTQEEQVIVADEGFAGLNAVTVMPIPNNYGEIIYNGFILVR